MAEKLPKQVFPTDISDFWISRGNFRGNIRLEHTQISKLALKYRNKPHLWSNHQVSTQSPHKLPRNYQKTVFCLEMTEFCNFSRYFFPNFRTTNSPNFQNHFCKLLAPQARKRVSAASAPIAQSRKYARFMDFELFFWIFNFPPR